MNAAVGVGVALAVLLAVTGCAGAEPPARSDQPSARAPASAPSTVPSTLLPARPREVALAGADACSVITPALRGQLGVTARMDRRPAGDHLDSSDCQWTNFPADPGFALFVRLVRNQGVEPYLNLPAARLTSVSGFGAVDLPGQFADPDEGCVVRVDVAPGQAVWAGYSSDGPVPGQTGERMCASAHAAAASVLDQLSARAR